jgi:hypothetical protein
MRSYPNTEYWRMISSISMSRGFAMGLIATTKVVTRSNMPGKPHLLQPGNREWVTTIECLNAKGWSIPTCIIFNGKVHIEGWYQDYALPSDWRIEVSENGWTTDEIGLRWLPKVFIPATTSRTIGRYRLLTLDGHGNHLTPAFDKACTDNDIVAICMPAHSSHLLQPLDVGCFGPLKRTYGGLVTLRIQLYRQIRLPQSISRSSWRCVQAWEYQEWLPSGWNCSF